MANRLALYKDTIKHLRFIRNLVQRHKEAMKQHEVDHEALTPYEYGRLTRSCTRIGNNLISLCYEHEQHRMVYWFMAYAHGILDNPGAFSKMGGNPWRRLWEIRQSLENQGAIDHDQTEIMIGHIAYCLDLPFSQMGSRIALMRLSIG